MQWVSLLGLLALLGLAWAMSYHRSKVRIRTVIWGLGLQFVFAVIILREDFWSYVGMVVLGTLVAVYLLRSRDGERSAAAIAVRLTVVAAIALAAYYLAAASLGWLAIAILVVLALDGRLGFIPEWARGVGGALFVAVGVAWMVENGIYGQVIFRALSTRVAVFLNLSDFGAAFLFGNLSDPQYAATPPGSPWPGFAALFAFKVLPTIIFFGGFMSVLYYLGIMQKVVVAVSRFVRWTIGTSGAETLSCTANVFVGQTEAPLLIKPFLKGMTSSELLTVMVGGFATIAGGVLAGYIAMGVPAGHLIAASVMSAPAALLIGKIIYPETEHSETAGDVEMPPIESGDNVIEAAANGITDGLKLAVNVGAMLLGFIALMAVVDLSMNVLDGMIDGRLLGGDRVEYGGGGLSPVTGEYVGYFPGSLRTLFGTVLSPLAWLMGVPWADATKVGNLLGIKLSLNEFVSYGTLGTYISEGALSERSIVIATYALCGFANFSSIGIQIGGISAVAPERKSDLARVGLRAMFGGALASWMTATIAGILLT